MPTMSISLSEHRLVKIMQRVFVFGDTTTIRAILAVGSLFWAILLWLPLHTFDRPSYADMKAFAPEWFWGLVFFLHFLGVMWRFIDPLPREGAGFLVNGFGLVVWITSSGLLTMSVGEMTPGLALEWTVIAAAAVALYRTGMNDEVVSP